MTKFLIVSLFIIVLLLVGGLIFSRSKTNYGKPLPTLQPTETTSVTYSNVPVTTVIAEHLDTPWAIAFLPGGSMLVTERKGNVRFVSADGKLDPTPVAAIESAQEIGEGGLLGIVLHPDFQANSYIYLYYTYASSENNTLNRVVRMTYRNKQLSDEKILLDRIPGAPNHNGGRIVFGPDKFLYIGTGDAQEPSLAQMTSSLAGKILRITDEGKIPADNPFHNPIYSYGHRNVQGFTFAEDGTLWATEHGRSGAASGLDELNIIIAGKNYGWPTIQGDETRVGMEVPKKHSGSTTWAPSGAAMIGNTLFFSGLRGQTLYGASIENNTVVGLTEHFKGEFGRLREVIKGPDGMLYMTTSNQDGRGTPGGTDDRIIRVNLQKL